MKAAMFGAAWSRLRGTSFPDCRGLVHYSGYNDVLRISAPTQRDGVDYNLAYIGSDFNAEHKEPFDRAYIRALFDYQRARAGYSWCEAPPILDTPGKA